MNNQNEKLQKILHKLEKLQRQHSLFQYEIQEIHAEISKLDFHEKKAEIVDEKVVKNEKPLVENSVKIEIPESPLRTEVKETEESIEEELPTFQNVPPQHSSSPEKKINWESYIGENLSNKIGIFITIIGVVIGVKYAIDNQLLSPLYRVLASYVIGVGLVVIAFRLKAKYENYSSVLLGGGLAIIYFSTYAAYGMYDLIPQIPAFILMEAIIISLVLSSLRYNRQIIAQIGVFGAYAIPFLLSDGSENYAFLFSYIFLFNLGVLVIALQRYWKGLYYSTFGITWLIFMVWRLQHFEYSDDYGLALLFSVLFFLLFYATFLVYKLNYKEKFSEIDVALILINSFLFFGFGYGLLSVRSNSGYLLGLFSLTNAIVHFGVSKLIDKKGHETENLNLLLSGLALVFLIIAIPIQFDGNWVTVIWAMIGALFFGIGKLKKVVNYEVVGYILLVLSSISLVHDWSVEPALITGSQISKIHPFINVNFLSSWLFVGAFAIVIYFQKSPIYESIQNSNLDSSRDLFRYLIPGMLLLVLFISFNAEISRYWNQRYWASAAEIPYPSGESSYMKNDFDLKTFGQVWRVNFALIFMVLLALVNRRFFKSQTLTKVSLILDSLAIIFFLIHGLWALSELRESYISNFNGEYFNRGYYHIFIRYISIFLFAALLYSIYLKKKESQINWKLLKYYEMVFFVLLLWVGSSELIHWIDLAGYTNTYKMGLSIFWGIYALAWIFVGIRRHQKKIRIAGMVLFGFTLLKLVVYDISDLDSLSRTIVLVSLGLLLLIISFLYNKFKTSLQEEPVE